MFSQSTRINWNPTIYQFVSYHSTYACQFKIRPRQANPLSNKWITWRNIINIWIVFAPYGMRRNNECFTLNSVIPPLHPAHFDNRQNASLSDVPSCARDFACVLVVTSTGTYPRLGCYLQRLNNILSDAARRHSWQWLWAGFSENRHVYHEFPLLCLLRENTKYGARHYAE